MKLGAFAAAILGLVSCTDPTGFGEAPEYLGLTAVDFAIVPREQGFRVASDSCPDFSPVLSGGTRRSIFDVDATIVLPANTEEVSRPFGKTAGQLFRIPAAGVIAISYDDSIATVTRSYGLGGRNSLNSSQLFSRWCPVTLATRDATLYTDFYKVVGDSAMFIAFGRAMAVTTSTRAGRRVNIRLSADVGPISERHQKVLDLLRAVRSIDWPP